MSALEAAQSRPDPARSASISFSALAPRASSTPGKTREIPNPSDCESEEEMDESSLLDKSSQDFKVSSDTLEFFREKFTTTTSNEVRRQWRSRFGHPKVDVASAPIMDKMVKSRLHPATKSRDKALSKQQALLLDAVGPLTYVLEEAGKETLTVQATVEACQQALAFIGNANMHLNRERRRNAILCMNRDLAEMAEDDDTFKTSAPQLFGDGFSRKAKERSEELKCLSQGFHRIVCSRRPSQPCPTGRPFKSGQFQSERQPVPTLQRKPVQSPVQQEAQRQKSSGVSKVSHPPLPLPLKEIKSFQNYSMSSVVSGTVLSSRWV